MKSNQNNEGSGLTSEFELLLENDYTVTTPAPSDLKPYLLFIKLIDFLAAVPSDRVVFILLNDSLVELAYRQKTSVLLLRGRGGKCIFLWRMDENIETHKPQSE